MKLLALDCSSQAASCAIAEDGQLLGEYFVNIRQTHSQTLLPMLDNLLASTKISLAEIELFALTTGPGSFTGLRIGMAAVKGLAFGLEKPCMGFSTLETLAWNLAGFSGTACAVLDARCGQVYTALFALEPGGPRRLTPDAALPLAELAEQLAVQNTPIFLVGDGAEMCYNSFSGMSGLQLAPAALRYQRAGSLCACAFAALQRGQAPQPAAQLAPAYLRLPQAERERLARTTSNPREENT